LKARCLACEARAGRLQLNPAPEIYSGSHWIVEHAHPTDILGWVVLATRQHRHALHDVTSEEWAEFQVILPRLIDALREVTECDKEYVAQFAEQEGFEHVHFHVIPRAKDWPADWRGFHVSAAMGASAKNPVSAEAMTDIAQRLRTTIGELGNE
jgi:diadenosine tetraphosphate (Ap4A) HIT family hydrolase